MLHPVDVVKTENFQTFCSSMGELSVDNRMTQDRNLPEGPISNAPVAQ